jgi:hypothetical protein
MVLCLCCHNINFDGDDWYWLLDAAPMAVSAGEGCPGCKFFLQSANLRFGQISVASNFIKEGIRVLLRRWSDTDTRVDLHFVRFEAGYKSYGIVPLRLCSAYGESYSCYEVQFQYLPVQASSRRPLPNPKSPKQSFWGDLYARLPRTLNA